MKDIPVFDTENGVATLILKEIPYYQSAYIQIHDSVLPAAFVSECKDFCRLVGAEHIYAKGHSYLKNFPLYTEIWEMSVARNTLPDTDAALFPLTDDTLAQWIDIYNNKMSSVANAAYMTTSNAKMFREQGSGYFIHRGDELLGIGIAAGDHIVAVCSGKRGAGFDCMLALNHALSGEMAHLQVASMNISALRLYEKMGFIKTSVVSCWYEIL
mgnify:CR=1 FL=1